MANHLPPKAETSQPDDDEKIAFLGKYKLGKSLGKGSYSVVKKATDIMTKKKYAIKIIDLEKLENTKNKKRIFREVGLLREFSHPHIVRLYDVFRISWKKTPGKYFLCLVLEHINGITLFEYIVSHGRLTEDEARGFFRQVLSALSYTHHHLVVHRDIKPENILLDENLQVKLIDFGFGNRLTPGTLFNSWLGSFFYAAPEIFLRKEYLGPEVDVWSLGVLLYTMLCGSYPWSKRSAEAIVHAEYSLPHYLSSEVSDLIKKIFQVDPTQRISLNGIVQHEWCLKGSQKSEPTLSPLVVPHPSLQNLPQVNETTYTPSTNTTSIPCTPSNVMIIPATATHSQPTTSATTSTALITASTTQSQPFVSHRNSSSQQDPNIPHNNGDPSHSVGSDHSSSVSIESDAERLPPEENEEESADPLKSISDTYDQRPTTTVSIDPILNPQPEIVEKILQVWPHLSETELIIKLSSDHLWVISYNLLYRLTYSPESCPPPDEEVIVSIPKVLYQNPSSPLLPGQKTLEAEGFKTRQRMPRRPDSVRPSLYAPQLVGRKSPSSVGPSPKPKSNSVGSNSNNNSISDDDKGWWNWTQFKKYDRIKLFKGPDTLGITSSRSPDTIMDFVKMHLQDCQYIVKVKRKYFLKCKIIEKSILFEVELCLMPGSGSQIQSTSGTPSSLSVKFTKRNKKLYRLCLVRRAGDSWVFKDVCIELLKIWRKKLSTDETLVFGVDIGTPSNLEPVPSILDTN